MARRMHLVGIVALVALLVATPSFAAAPVVTHVCPTPLPDADDNALCVFFMQGTGLTGASTTVAGQPATTMPLSDCIMAIKCTTLPPTTVPVTVTTAGGSTIVPVTFATPCDPTADLACLLDILPCFQEQGLVRSRGAFNALSQRLSQALASLQRGRINAAIQQLDATAHYVSAQSGRGFAPTLSTALSSFLGDFLLPCLRLGVTFGQIEDAAGALGPCHDAISASGVLYEDDFGTTKMDGYVFGQGTVGPACLPAVVTLQAKIVAMVSSSEPVASIDIALVDPRQEVSNSPFDVASYFELGTYVQDVVDKALDHLRHPAGPVDLRVCVVVEARVTDSCGCVADDQKELCGNVHLASGRDTMAKSDPTHVFPVPSPGQDFEPLPCEIELVADPSATTSQLAAPPTGFRVHHGYTVFDALCPPVTVSGTLSVVANLLSNNADDPNPRVVVGLAASNPASSTFNPSGRGSFDYDDTIKAINSLVRLNESMLDALYESCDVTITLIAVDSCGCVKVVSVSSRGLL